MEILHNYSKKRRCVFSAHLLSPPASWDTSSGWILWGIGTLPARIAPYEFLIGIFLERKWELAADRRTYKYTGLFQIHISFDSFAWEDLGSWNFRFHSDDKSFNCARRRILWRVMHPSCLLPYTSHICNAFVGARGHCNFVLRHESVCHTHTHTQTYPQLHTGAKLRHILLLLPAAATSVAPLSAVWKFISISEMVLGFVRQTTSALWAKEGVHVTSVACNERVVAALVATLFTFTYDITCE